MTPSYHGNVRANLINNIVHGFTLLSDDDGDTFYLGATDYSGNGKSAHNWCNENQAVELKNGSLLASARSPAIPIYTPLRRLQTVSLDGGKTFEGSW